MENAKNNLVRSVSAPIIDLSGRPAESFVHIVQSLNKSARQVNDGGTNSVQSTNNEVKNKGHIVIPYTQGLCESIRKICGRYGIQTHFKGGRTIKNLLVFPKDKDPYGQPKWCHLLVPM